MKSKERFKLKSGKTCEIIKIEKNLIPNYYLIAFPKTQGEPSIDEVSEMLQVGIKHAKIISRKLLGDEEAFTMLYSGYSARREKGWHIHIVLLGNRWKKAWLYIVLSFKNLLQAIGLRKDDSPKIR
jgi:hypothetical protein